MQRLWKHEFKLAWFLGAVCASLVAVIYVEIERSDEGPATQAAASTSSSPHNSPAPARTFTAVPISDYSEVTERPLFSATRRPSARSSAADGNTGNLLLIGTVVSRTSRHALIRHKQDSRVERVAEGQDIDGWTVEAIEGDRVLLRRAGSSLDLKASARANKP